MKPKALNPSQVGKMKEMVQRGVAPKFMSNYFGASISTIHNYKKEVIKELAAEGINIPSMQGRRKGFSGTGLHTSLTGHNRSNTGQTVSSFGNKPYDYRFEKNGTVVSIQGNPKGIALNEQQMEISF